jgi:thiamine biosynthesis lipoprotein
VLIDLGGIAKGFAVDRAVEALIAAGVSHGVVNAGGDVRVFGTVDHVVHIRSGHGGLDRAISIRDGAVASSSNVGSRYQYGTTMRTPHVAPGDVAVLIDDVISVVADKAVIADAMTKVAMLDVALANRILVQHGGAVVGTVAGATS